MSEKKSTRRSFLEAIGSVIVVGLVGKAAVEISSPDKKVVRAARAVDEDKLREISLELHAPFSYESFLRMLPEFPKHASLMERVDRACRD